jgi:hypothetical protein
MKVMFNILENFDFPRIEYYENLLESLSSFLYQSMIRPSLRPDEKRKFSA